MAPEMQIDYYARSTLGGFWRQNWSNGMWAILPFAHVSGNPIRWRHLAPLALVLGLVSSAAAGMWSRSAWLASAVAVPYLAANISASVRAAWKERDTLLAFLLPIVFASLHLAYGAGSVWGCARLGRHFFRPAREAA